MQAEIAAVPEIAKPRRAAEVLARLSLPAVVFLSLALELALAERKFGVFGGGFGQSRAVDAPFEMAAFFAALLACHALIFYLLFRLTRRLHGRRADTALFHFNFFYFASFGAAAVLIGKYQALSYFSDALSFQIVRNLGGGSIVEALRYSASEASLILFIALGAAAAYAAAYFALRRRWRETGPLPDRTRLTGRQLAAALVLTPMLLFGAARIDDSRYGLSRFNSYYLAAAILNEATDPDRDGYGLFSYPLDTHMFDGSRHPYALDVPGNGIDEDGFAGDLAVSDTPPPAERVAIAGARPHIVLIVLESTRGDVIGHRIAGRPVAPNLEALAAEGTLVRDAYSHVGFTTASLQTLFTGRLAPSDERGSLFQLFQANGYRMGVFSGQAEDFGGIAETAGMRRSDIFVDAQVLREERAFDFAALASLKVEGSTLLREFDRHLGRPEQWQRPNFLYFNLQSAHFPYHSEQMDQILPGTPIPRSEIVAHNREWVAATYWNAVAYNDRLIGQLVARLKRLGVWENSVVIVTGDHGEELFEDGFLGHGHMINRRQTHIPFVISRPMAISGPLGLADMRDIVLRAAGASLPAARAPAQGVFQYIGGLERPSSIGFAHGGEQWTIFSFDREALWTNAGGWRPYSELAAGTPDRRRADELISEWGRQRWRQLQGS